jgi:hypothetical protein
MSTPISKTSGSLSTNGTVTSGAGVVTYAQAIGGTMSLYDGSTSGNLLLTVTSSGYVPLPIPVQFSSTAGLYATFSAGSGVVHHT